jgi:hypothetical protein
VTVSEDVPRHPPRALLAALDAAFARPPEQPLADAAFDILARGIFAWQFQHNLPYRAYCEHRGRTPERVTHWSAIPAVPTAAFREVALVAGDAGSAEAVFRTSGTTRGQEKRGVHHVLDISVYHRALLSHFAAMLLPDGARLALHSLVPAPRDLPDSSLAHMIATVLELLGSRRSGWHASAAAGLDVESLDRALRDAQQRGEPVCLLGTSFAFVHWLDALREQNLSYRLPEGSRLMDTGGFKGRSREVGEEELRSAYVERFGIAPYAAVNEYGMTELCSQFYDTTLREHVLRARPGARRKQAPAWVRTRIVDPETLEPLSSHHEGLLQHFDLANIGSVLAVQTEDVGVEVDDGFRLLGRAAGAVPRGCSIAMDELLAAARAPRS